jgi:hypothetical protein
MGIPAYQTNVPADGDFDHGLNGTLDVIAEGGNTFTQDAIDEFTAAVSAEGVTTGDVIAAAARLKMKLGAAKAYYDVISTLGDDQKRLIEGAVK